MVRKEPSIKRQKMDSDGDRPFRCEICTLAFKEVGVVAATQCHCWKLHHYNQQTREFISAPKKKSNKHSKDLRCLQ